MGVAGPLPQPSQKGSPLCLPGTPRTRSLAPAGMEMNLLPHSLQCLARPLLPSRSSLPGSALGSHWGDGEAGQGPTLPIKSLPGPNAAVTRVPFSCRRGSHRARAGAPGPAAGRRGRGPRGPGRGRKGEIRETSHSGRTRQTGSRQGGAGSGAPEWGGGAGGLSVGGARRGLGCGGPEWKGGEPRDPRHLQERGPGDTAPLLAPPQARSPRPSEVPKGAVQGRWGLGDGERELGCAGGRSRTDGCGVVRETAGRGPP